VRARALLPGILAASLLTTGAVARAEIIERVVVVVNDEVILLSELRRRALPYLDNALADADTKEEKKQRVRKLYQDLLEQLIDDQLFQQEARTMRVTVSSLELDQAIDRVRQQNNLQTDQFWEAVRAQGYTPEQYREDVRKQLLHMKVLNQRVRSKVTVSEDDARARYDEQLRQSRRTLRFRAAHIFFELPPSASATEVAAARRQAEQARVELNADNFDAAIRKYSGGELGWLSQGDLPRELEQTLLGLDPGQISQPTRGPSGIHLFLLRERQRGSTTLPPFGEVKKRLQQEMTEEAMSRQQRVLLDQLRHKATIDKKL
jgi:peptidyl-prolyl cis-trans isomerase SurA